jgi:hypothetical protein
MALGWVAAFAAAFAAQVGTPPPARTVPCSEAIATTRFPYQDRERRYRLILGVVSLPTYLEQIVPSPDPRWPYWRKQGLVVRASGETVTITVPRA